MIYNPKHFEVETKDRHLILEIIQRYNFATLIAVRDGTPFISHLPFMYDASRGEHGILTAHMARANPQWRSFVLGDEVTAVFSGPHAYVSPRWYEPQPDNVPTWNYAVVHVHGVPRVIKDSGPAFETLKALVQQHDPTWTLVLSDKDRQEMLNEIVVFEVVITRIESKFKLSQNRTDVDRETVMKQLNASASEIERETGALMNKLKF